jgi:amino acid adenylation domain-containing protein
MDDIMTHPMPVAASLPVAGTATSARAVRHSPATTEQRKLHTLHQLYPADPAYNGPLLHRIGDGIDLDRLRAAFERVLHASRGLNTTFENTADGLFTQDNRDRAYQVRTESVGDESDVVNRVRAIADTPVSPDRWPLYDVRLWQGKRDRYVSVVFSHLVADVTSIWSLYELVRLGYEDPAALASRLADLETVPGNGWHENGWSDEGKAVEFFRSHLAELSRLDHDWLRTRRGPDGRVAGRTTSMALGAALSHQVKVAVKEAGVTPFAFFLAAYLVVLSRLTSSARVVTGIPVANRHGRAERRAIGCFVNTLPLSVDTDAWSTFGELARHLQESTFHLLRHQGFNLTAHAAEVFGGRRPDLLSVDNAFTYYGRPLSFSVAGHPFEWVDVPRACVKYPLAVTVENGVDGFTVVADVATHLVPSTPLECLRTVLEQAGRCPEAPLADLALVALDPPSAVRRHDVPVSVAHYFDEVARTYSDHVAVEDTETTLTYRELADRVDRVGRWLAAHVPEDYVAVSGPRTVDLVVAIMGVLRAGKTYVPLDPQAPAGRLRHIVAVFPRLPVLLTGPVDLDIREPDRLDLREVEAAAPATGDPVPRQGGNASSVVIPDGDPERAAYVIFTSGSTGAPKGVEVTHAGLGRLIRTTQEIFGFGPADTWTLFHSHAFDFSVWEIFGALLSGGRLVVVPPMVARTPADFRELLCAHGVTVLNQTPSAFMQLLHVLGPADRDRLRLRLLFLGGEAVRFQALSRWFELMGDGCRVFNIYGPTEGSVWVTYHEIDADQATHERESVIGQPLPDVNLYIVDGHLHPLPPGVCGELLIGGVAPARGYLGQPEATSARFVPGPWQDERTYRTGDVVRLRPDGALVYVGRQDSQVQLRGYRIELGEVEAALAAVPGIRDVTVRVDAREGIEPRLVAYLVESRTVTDQQIRDQVRTVLPGYMVPALLLRLPALPLTVNGKVDDVALPLPPLPAAIDPDEDGSLTQGVAGRVRCVWEQVIGTSGINLDENFFDTGGTSMHVAEIHGRLVDAFDIDGLAMVDLFEYTTVRTLASRIEDLLAGTQATRGGHATIGRTRPAPSVRRRRPGR